MASGIRNIFLCIVCALCSVVASAQVRSVSDAVNDSVLVRMLCGDNWYSIEKISLKSVVADGQQVRVRFNKTASTVLLNQQRLDDMTDSIRRWLDMPKAKVVFYADQRDLSQLLPKRYAMPRSASPSAVRRLNNGTDSANLSGRTFAVWNSHGRYYEHSLNRWEWQRARLFTTVEDLLSSSFVLPFLVPMLENGGANVFLPRERDMQSQKVVAHVGYEGNLAAKSLGVDLDVPEDGEYGVYVRYPEKADAPSEVIYSIHHAGGISEYSVCHKVAADMWVYLGTHHFTSGCHVEIKADGPVAISDIRLGGGMGTVERDGSTSGMPAWMEGARYYLETDGFPSSVYAPGGGTNDYTDDINCRGEWVNALRDIKHLGVDASIALHTDAGVMQADSIYGTLTIVNTKNGTAKYADGRNRMIAHSLAHIIESQIVGDVRQTWSAGWTERGIWDKGYSEARRQDLPSVLIEMLSHQNLNDIRLALHPQFRFDVCRAIYKGMLRFFEGDDAVVQPLPVQRFGMKQVAPDSLLLSWMPAVDPLELSAKPDGYMVYADGALVAQLSDTCITVSQPKGKLVEYQVVAINKGGRSFPSMTLGAYLNDKNAQTAIFVDGFDRLSAPDVVNEATWRGIIATEPGVGWGSEQFTTGSQYDFNPQSLWLDDDAPGCGASFADMEQKTTIGSHTRHVPDEVRKLVADGYTVISQSKDYFENDRSALSCSLLRIWLDRQKTTWYGSQPSRHAIYTKEFMRRMTDVVATSPSIFISGSFVGTDLQTPEAKEFASKILGFTFRTNHASQTIDGAIPDAIEPSKGAKTTLRYSDSQMSAEIQKGNIRVRGY